MITPPSQPTRQSARHRAARIDSLEPRSLFAAGLAGSYLPDLNLASSSVVNVASDLPAHTWPAGQSPVGGIDATTFSATWTGQLTPASTGATRFYVKTDGGVRVWIDHRLIVDDWSTLNRARELKGSIALTQGEAVAIHIDYRHDLGAGTIVTRWQTDTLAKQTVPLDSLTADTTPPATSLERRAETALAFAKQSAKQTIADLKPGAFPDSASLTQSRWSTVPATSWTSGFFGGTLWELNDAVGGFGSAATQWTTPLASTASLPGDHLGRIWATYKPLYDATKSKSARDVLLKAAASKAGTWSKKVKAFQTKDIASSSGNAHATFGVLMDQTMDIELLLWAADQNHDDGLRARVVQHMKTVAKTMIRADGSVVQRGFFDGKTGELVSLENYQGLNNTSTWSRGQAWAIDSFSRVAELTGDATLLATAQRVADYFIDHAPSDGVPLWDFSAPSKSSRDSSAGAIATVGLYRLSSLLNEPTSNGGDADRRYGDHADALLSSLTSPRYMVYGQPVASGVSPRGILAHGASNVPKHKGTDVALTYGDYFLVQAINAYRA